MRNDVFGNRSDRVASGMANLLLSTLWSIAASTTSNRPESLSAPSPTPWTGLHCGVTSLSPLQPPSCPTAARVSLRRWDHGPPWRRQGGPPGCRSLWPVCRRWWERREAVERRCDPGSGPPAVQFGVTLAAARRRPPPPVTSGLGDLHAGGNPVLRRPDGLAAMG